MIFPSHEIVYEVLCLQAASEGREEALFGDCLARARSLARPFMVGNGFPEVYFEFPLFGEPFLDVTVLYDKLDSHTRIDSPLVGEAQKAIDWFSKACKTDDQITLGFEIDVKDRNTSQAAVHFQHRERLDLVKPFFESMGEPERVKTYLDFAERKPQGWKPAFLGMFRNRPDSPLRVCGYLDAGFSRHIAEDPWALPDIFNRIGFTSYDNDMLSQIANLMSVAPEALDFQFDVFPDGSVGSIIAFDVQFKSRTPQNMTEYFSEKEGKRVMSLLDSWGIADGRWKLGIDMAFAQAIPVELDDGTTGRYALTLMPKWLKVRWSDGVLQPAKFYSCAFAKMLE